MKRRLSEIAIIGAGASGLAAGIAAAGAGARRVSVFERNAFAGKKINATGNGRCNYLNEGIAPEKYFSSSPEDAASALLDSVFSAYPLEKLKAFFEELGIVPAGEEEGRLYPRSFSARDVSEALIRGAESRGVDFVCEFPVYSVKKEASGFVLTSEKGEKAYADKLILACGGKAGGQYGCFGDGFRFARGFGHGIIKPIPALTGLLCSEKLGEAAGARVKAGVGLYRAFAAEGTSGEKAPLPPSAALLARDCGELQFTADALSGICVFNISRFLRKEPGCEYYLSADLFEEYSEDELFALLEERRERFGSLEATLFGLLPRRLVKYISGRFGAGGTSRSLARLCKNLCFEISATKSWNDAQVTSGGVKLSEINPEDLSSKLVSGLSFAGEILDVDGPCGGYNLGFAFASGLLAGSMV